MSTRYEALLLVCDTFNDELLDVLLAVADKLRLYPRSSPETKATVSFDEEAFRYEE